MIIQHVILSSSLSHVNLGRLEEIYAPFKKARMSRVTLEQIFKLAGRGDTFVLSPEIMPRVPLALGDRPNIRTAVDAVIATSAILKEYLRNTYDPGSPRMQNLVDMFCDYVLTAAIDGFEG